MNDVHVRQDTLIKRTEAFTKSICAVRVREHEIDISLLEVRIRLLLLPRPKINANCTMSLGYYPQQQSFLRK
jgi:hypothetical protein